MCIRETILFNKKNFQRATIKKRINFGIYWLNIDEWWIFVTIFAITMSFILFLFFAGKIHLENYVQLLAFNYVWIFAWNEFLRKVQSLKLNEIFLCKVCFCHRQIFSDTLKLRRTDPIYFINSEMFAKIQLKGKFG